jgi:hypothetical protein
MVVCTICFEPTFMKTAVLHHRHEETPEVKARWFQSLTFSEAHELCAP